MKYIFFSVNGEGMAIAHKLQNEGQEVYVGIVSDVSNLNQKESPEKKRRRLSLYDGMLDKKYDADKLIEMMKDEPNKEDFFVFCDFNSLWPYAKKAKAMGYRGLLPTENDYKLEQDREMAKNLVKERYKDLEVAEFHQCKTIEDSKEFLSGDKLWVLKGSGDAPTIVPKTTDSRINHEHILYALQEYRKEYEKGGYILEEMIPDILEFTPEAIAFDGKLLGVWIDIEAKYFGAGDTGCQVGCGLELGFWIPLPGNKVYEMFLKPMEKDMLRKGELTIWDASVIYSPSRNKFYFGEYCPNRPGYDSEITKLSTFPRVSEYFEKIAKKQPIYDYTTKIFGSSVRMFTTSKDDKIPELFKDDLAIFADVKDPNIWIWDTKKKGKHYVTAGFGEELSVISGSGNTPEDSIAETYRNAENFHFMGEYHRPIHDFMSRNYPTSVLNRLDWFERLFGSRIPSYATGYDFDGVISEGIVPEENAVVITGNTESGLPKVIARLAIMKRHSIPVYHYPNEDELLVAESDDDRNRLIGEFKARKVKELGIRKFFEDTPIQGYIIKQMNPETKVIMITDTTK